MTESKPNDLMERIVSLCKRRGFIFQSSEIYGGINGFWDYGPLGAELKRNIKDYWWRAMTRLRDDVVGLDASIIMHPKIWEASGHTSTFADAMVDCLLTKKRYRADQIAPQSGIAYHYSGAEEVTPAEGKPKTARALLVLCRMSKHIGGAPTRRPRRFYRQRGSGRAAFCWANGLKRWRIPPGITRRTAVSWTEPRLVQPDVQDLRRPDGER